MNYRFVAIDVDGTLLDSNKNLSLYTKETIQRCIASGITVCICTGRPVQTIERFTELLGVQELPAIQGMPFILYNGAMVAVGGKHDIIFEQPLSETAGRELLSLGQKLGSTLIAWSQNKLYVNELNERIENYCTITPVEPIVITDPDALAKQGITKMIWYDEAERMPALIDELNAKPVRQEINYFTSNPLFLELVDRRCSKGLAIEQLIQHLGIPREETIAIGDGYNDIPMLEYAGLGIAMGNACDAVNAAADAVTDTNDNDGVAKALIQYFSL